MGAGASVVDPNDPETIMPTVHLKKLPDAIEESIFTYEKFPLLIDPSEQAARFLKYQLGSFIRYDDPAQCTPEYLNRCLVGAFRYGRTLTLKVNSLEDVDRAKLFANPKLFPEAVLDRSEFCKVWQSVLTDEDDDPSEMSISPEFVFVICTKTDHIPEAMQGIMRPINVTDKAPGADEAQEGGNPEMDSVAELFGGKEIIRNSEQLVEAAFDGDLDEVVSWIEKGFHLESTDGRKHTALSEAACQGHMHMVEYLIKEGADPNALSDNGRSALWRASFGGHVEVVKALLEAGGDPTYRDKVSMESAYDVTQSDEMKEVFQNWSLERTETLKAARKRAVIAKIEERIRTAADREFYARQKIREEIVEKATAGDVDGVKEILHMVADEAEKENCRPRVTAEARNDDGLSLLAIAALTDDLPMATLLLTHWRECDNDRWDLNEGELSVEASTFKTNVNSRDLKGWNCACIAVFHKSLKVLQALCEHGANLSMRSMYNKNAYDLAKDELDAAENVVTDRSAIRDVIQEFDQFGTKKNVLFGTSSAKVVAKGDEVLVVDPGSYEGLNSDGSPVVMQLEMQKSNEIKDKASKKGGNAKKPKVSKKK
jgi:ankyrin repeat protein